jgi:hypothetical protein
VFKGGLALFYDTRFCGSGKEKGGAIADALIARSRYNEKVYRAKQREKERRYALFGDRPR